MRTVLKIAAATIVAVLLSGCATRSGVAPASSRSKPSAGSLTSGLTQPDRTAASAAEPDAGRCDGAGAAFSLSLVAGLSGEPTPGKAAERFVVHGGVPGYGDASSDWQVTGRDSSGVTVTAGTVRLHALRLTDRTWAIDAGQRCT